MNWRWKSLDACDLDELIRRLNGQMKALENILNNLRPADAAGQAAPKAIITSRDQVEHTGTTAETTLKETLLGPGSNNPKSGFKLVAAGTATGASAKTLTLTFGGVEVGTLEVTGGDTTWQIEATVWNIGSTSAARWLFKTWDGDTPGTSIGEGESVYDDDEYADAYIARTGRFSIMSYESWATIRAGAGNNADDTTPDWCAALYADYTGDEFPPDPASGWGILNRGFCTFDLSALSGAVIDTATLSLYGELVSAYGPVGGDIISPFATDQSVQIVGVTPTNPLSVADADYGTFASTAFASKSIPARAYDGSNTWHDFALSSAGVAYLNTLVGGNAPLGCRLSGDVSGAEPAKPGAGYGHIVGLSTDGDADPCVPVDAKLTLEYHVPGGPSGTVTVGGLKWDLDLSGELADADDTLTVDVWSVELYT
jgi:hypothetical protein